MMVVIVGVGGRGRGRAKHFLVCVSFPVSGWHVSGGRSAGINSVSGFRLARRLNQQGNFLV